MTSLPKIFGERRLGPIMAVAGLAVFQAACAGVAAFATRDIFAALAVGSAAVPYVSLAVLGAMGCAIAMLRVGERCIAEWVGQSFAASLRTVLFKKLTLMPAREIARRRSGGLGLRFVGDLATVRGWVSLGVARIISAAIVLPGSFVALYMLNPALAAAAAGPIVMAVGIMLLLAPRLRPLHAKLRSRRARLAADVIERVPVARELHIMGRARKELDRVARNSARLRALAVRRAWAKAGLRSVPEVGSAIAGVLVLAAALATGAPGYEAAGALAVLAILMFPLRDLAGISDRAREWSVAREKCLKLLDAPAFDEAGRKRRGKFPDTPAALRFRAVSGGGLEMVDAQVWPGEVVAIVGRNGAGKSSLLALAAGLEPVSDGSVEIDGMAPDDLVAGSRRSAIAYVGPRSPILKGSLRRALTLGIRPRPDDAEIERVARDLGLEPVLTRLGGLDGEVAAGGQNLSAGEARRVHLARAVLAEPRLLLLDEPDDSLDKDGRAALAKVLQESRATTLVVTHDMGLARRADVVWSMEAGVLKSRGHPEAVLRPSVTAA